MYQVFFKVYSPLDIEPVFSLSRNIGGWEKNETPPGAQSVKNVPWVTIATL